MSTALPDGAWGADLVQSFFAGERVTYLVQAAVVGVVATYGALSLTDSHTAEEQH